MDAKAFKSTDTRWHTTRCTFGETGSTVKLTAAEFMDIPTFKLCGHCIWNRTNLVKATWDWNKSVR